MIEMVDPKVLHTWVGDNGECDGRHRKRKGRSGHTELNQAELRILKGILDSPDTNNKFFTMSDKEWEEFMDTEVGRIP